MEFLPNETLQEILDQADFPTIIELYETNRRIHSLLECPVVRQSQVDTLIDFRDDCRNKPDQARLLKFLNDKFHLGVNNPTFPKLKRAYLHSAANPQCLSYSSITHCMKSAAKLGLSDQLKSDGPWFTIWDETQNQLLERIRQAPSLSAAYSEELDDDEERENILYNWKYELSILANRNGHLQLGSDLIFDLSAAGGGIERKAVYYYYKAWVKFLLQPYKVRTTRQIRAQYSRTLYDQKIFDQEKAAIWGSKYQFLDSTGTPLSPEQIEIAFKRAGADTNSVNLALTKLGLLTFGYVNLAPEVATLFAVQSGKSLIVQSIIRGRLPDISLTKALKLGYFELFNKFKANDPRPMRIVYAWGNIKPLFRYFRKFNLEQLQSIGNFLTPNSSDLFQYILAGQNLLAYFEYVTQNPASIGPFAVLDWTRYGISGLDMLSDFLTRLDPRDILTRQTITSFFTDDVNLLAKIWNQFGRTQFEDALIYLRMRFGYTAKPRPMWWAAVGEQALGLLAYLAGYELNHQGQLIELTSPGIISMTLEDIQEFVRQIPINSGEPDVNMLILDIYDKLNT